MRFLALGTVACDLLNNLLGDAQSALLMDTDARIDAYATHSHSAILMGEAVFHGYGSGGNHTAVTQQLLPEQVKVCEFCQQNETLIVLAALGGGTGCGLVSEVVKLAKDAGAFVIVIPIMPFAFEGKVKAVRAQTLLQKLQNQADMVLPFYNDGLFQMLPETVRAKEALEKGNQWLKQLLDCLRSVFEPQAFAKSMAFPSCCDALQQYFSHQPGSVGWGIGNGNGDQALHDAFMDALRYPGLHDWHSDAVAHAFIIARTTSDVPLKTMCDLQPSVTTHWSLLDEQVTCHYDPSLPGSQRAEVLCLLSNRVKNLQTVRVDQTVIQTTDASKPLLEYQNAGNECYWDTPTYLRLGIRLDG